jgi:hypothetical protein
MHFILKYTSNSEFVSGRLAICVPVRYDEKSKNYRTLIEVNLIKSHNLDTQTLPNDAK